MDIPTVNSSNDNTDNHDDGLDYTSIGLYDIFNDVNDELQSKNVLLANHLNMTTKFEHHRKELRKRLVNDMLNKMNDIKKLKDVEVAALSMRHGVLEDVHFLMDQLHVIERKLTKYRGDEVNRVLNAMQQRIKTKEERDAIVNSDEKIANTMSYKAIIETQISFYNELKSTLGTILYSIKNRVELSKMLGE
jgi:hypothetical protein